MVFRTIGKLCQGLAVFIFLLFLCCLVLITLQLYTDFFVLYLQYIFYLTSGVMSFISGMCCFLLLLLLLTLNVSQQNTSNPSPAKLTWQASSIVSSTTGHPNYRSGSWLLGAPQKGDVAWSTAGNKGHLSSLLPHLIQVHGVQMTPVHRTWVCYAGCQAWQH